MKQIAIYGKGGIGKSTISANLSAALSLQNQKVLQVGCDPKHDSTRLLLDGNAPATVLEYLKNVAPEDYSTNDILCSGFNGIDCVEAGGPEPGVGCAGRGILSTFSLLEDLGVLKNNYDLVLYDVLGDVVCGGFAVPIRNEYADAVYIVTSGEFMSIYSANNILRGVTHYNESKHRIGGIIFNRRNIDGEEERVRRFCEAVGLPILIDIPRSNEFAVAEKQGKTLVECMPESDITSNIHRLAGNIVNEPTLYEAKPLSETDLEQVVLGKRISGNVPAYKKENKPTEPIKSPQLVSSKLNKMVSKNVMYREPLHGCAYCGAMHVCTQINDAIVISHGPKSCAHMAYNAITSSGRRALNERGTIFPNQIQPNVVSTDKDENVMVFGGNELLAETIERCKKKKPSAIFVVSACTSGIIGDELKSLYEDGDIPVIPVETDGDIEGDYMQGNMMANVAVAKYLVNKDLVEEALTVNIIGEKSFHKNSENNYEAVADMITKIGLNINCRFLINTPLDSVRELKKASLNIQAYNDYKGRMLQDYFERELDMKFFDLAFPVGYFETTEFLRQLGKQFSIDDTLIENTLNPQIKKYEQRLESLKKILKGKRIVVVIYNRNIDWLLELIQHLEMNLVNLCIINSCQEDRFNSRYAGEITPEMNYEMKGKEDEIRSMKPDILLSNYNAAEFGNEFFTDTVPYSPENGMFGPIDIAERWAEIFNKSLHEGWKADEQYFLELIGL